MGADKTERKPKSVSTFVNLKKFDLVTRVSRAQGSALLVMYSLARHFNNDENCSRPSTALIAAEAHMSIRNVHRMIDALEASGEVSVYRQKDQVNRYYIQLKDTLDGKLEFAARVMKSAMEDSGKYRVAVSHAPQGAGHVTTSSRGTGQPRHVTTGQGRHAAHDKVVTLISNEQSTKKNQGTSSGSATLDAIPSGEPREVGTGRLAEILEHLEGIRGLRGNKARGKNKRYSCKLTLDELRRLASSLLKERPADLVIAALENFSWGEGFTSGQAFVQKLALRKWVLGQKPPLLDETIALLERVDADAVLGELGLNRFIPFVRHRDDDFRRYITSDDLFRLHDALKLAV